ncbi:MAG: HDOD domain-containing protein [Phycisphaerales bacterium]|nr:HDOD domain-containing protein [Phycisphaerales bacterium]
MNKPRGKMSAGEVETLLQSLERKLERVGIETQPEVATRILTLVQDPNSQLRDYAGVIKTDHAICGRLLKLANSAFFAQREPVTSIERACVLLGTTRLRTLALGFFMARAAGGVGDRDVSRQVWTQSVFRACLAQSLAGRIAPEARVEAFVIGLMLDAGIPLQHKIQGEAVLAAHRPGATPAAAYKAELTTLPFTHVDVVGALLNKWRFPKTLCLPIQWHHVAPGEAKRSDLVLRLHRIAFYAGAVSVDPQTAQPITLSRPPAATRTAEVGPGEAFNPRDAIAEEAAAAKKLGLERSAIDKLVAEAVKEYQTVCDVFGEVADRLDGPEAIAAMVHARLAEVMDEQMTRHAAAPSSAMQRKSFRIVDSNIEIMHEDGHGAVAYLLDAKGVRISSCRFDPIAESAHSICFSLGVDLDDEHKSDPMVLDLDQHIKSLAA